MRPENCDAAFQNCKKPDGNFITVKIGKILIEVLINSGSGHSLMSEGVAQAFRLRIKPMKDPEHYNSLEPQAQKLY